MEEQESASKKRRLASGLFKGARKVEKEIRVRRRARNQLSLLKKWSGDIPIANWFKENPMGNLVALFLLFMIVYLWTGALPTNPYVNDANFVSQWGLFYNTTKWMLAIAIPGFLIAIAYSAIHEGAQKQQGISTGASGISGTIAGFTASIRARAQKISAPKIEAPKPMGVSPVTGSLKPKVEGTSAA